MPLMMESITTNDPSSPRTRPHGTRTRYVHDRCRCMPCRIAATRYETARYERYERLPFMARRVHGGWWHVWEKDKKRSLWKSTDRSAVERRVKAENARWRIDHGEPLWCRNLYQVRRYVRTLQAQGLGFKRIAELAHMSKTRLEEIMLGVRWTRNRPQRVRILQRTAEKLFAVETTARAAPGARVPAARAWQLVAQLHAQGWTKQRIARALGSTAKVPALQLGKTRVLQSTLDRLEQLVGGRSS